MVARMVMVVMMVVLVGCSSAPQPVPTVSAELSTVQRANAIRAEIDQAQARDESFAAVGKIARAAYERHFTQAVRAAIIARADADELAVLFDAGTMATFYTLDPAHGRQALEAFDALAARSLATPKQREEAGAIAFKTRLFHRTGLALHDESGGQLPTELVVRGDVATRRTVTLSGSQIVVSSGCHFAEDALTAIAADPQLAAAFARARWMVPQEGGTVDDARDPRFTVAYDRDEYPMIDSWNSPTFYFLIDGRVVKKIVGWPRDEVAARLAELRDGVKLLGL